MHMLIILIEVLEASHNVVLLEILLLVQAYLIDFSRDREKNDQGLKLNLKKQSIMFYDKVGNLVRCE